MLPISVLQQPRGRRFERAWLPENVPRVDGTEFLLCKTALVGPVGVNSAEGVAGEGVSELLYLRSGVAKRSQYFAQRGIFPKGTSIRARASRKKRHTK